MRRPFYLYSLAVVGVGVASGAADGVAADQSTWRWTIDAALDAQRVDETAGSRLGSLLAAANYNPHYERYTVTGQPEAAR